MALFFSSRNVATTATNFFLGLKRRGFVGRSQCVFWAESLEPFSGMASVSLMSLSPPLATSRRQVEWIDGGLFLWRGLKSLSGMDFSLPASSSPGVATNILRVETNKKRRSPLWCCQQIERLARIALELWEAEPKGEDVL
jgi:hypothetical protein